VIKGQATEVIDVGPFLPMAFADWFSRKENAPLGGRAIGCCWSTTRRSSANMLAPVLKAAGYRVRVFAPNAQEGLLALRSGPRRSTWC